MLIRELKILTYMNLILKQYIFLKTIGLKGWEIAKFVSSGHTVWETEASTNGRGQTWSWINGRIEEYGVAKSLKFPRNWSQPH